ncbi:hypothetical protein MTR_5g046945 [Medicago truncatula]|uniref:Uncharacterized protein n=1 Tax=Medicago truncatula TaxID=3880 RepID=A0A072UE43_MEDTR|nr:hypothetical protein MTR_5g046945 [Medicago truncatula]
MDLVFSLNQSQNELAQNQNQTQNLRNCVHGFRIGKVKKKQIFKENKEREVVMMLDEQRVLNKT